MMNGGYKKMDVGKIYESVKAVAMFFLLILFIDFGSRIRLGVDRCEW